KIPDAGEVVHRGTAAVEPNLRLHQRPEGFLSPRVGIVEANQALIPEVVAGLSGASASGRVSRGGESTFRMLACQRRSRFQVSPVTIKKGGPRAPLSQGRQSSA